jgi:hypothetical protein
MEAFKSPSKVISAFCCVLLCNGGLAVPFAIFWLNNPDATVDWTVNVPSGTTVTPVSGTMVDCWANPTLPTSVTASGTPNWGVLPRTDNSAVNEAYKNISDNTDWTNVTNNFISWFEWGFILSCVFIAGSFTAACGGLLKSNFLMQISSLVTGCTSCFGFLAWFICGNVFRWRAAGFICSGRINNPTAFPNDTAPDNVGLLLESGKFINIWNIIFYSLCACCCCLSIIGTVMSKKKSG